MPIRSRPDPPPQAQRRWLAGKAVWCSDSRCPWQVQVASKEFFLKTLPLFDGGDDVGMVLSPQCFHNLNLHSDIFNHSNVHFWEYMQPGYDALGFISCTGTNFLVRLPIAGRPHHAACF